ncbi:hypothetical protein SAMN05192529_105142 [Arachidicoccus rhizosphaerae]|jgi:hypothetical protein|uniref:Uncharacterized protein n=1 Tax=Arachidicoccus rhizosphaerae TaxID=551991 RepID=A0A1H3XFJ8_9BACT|nr:hypothetical protein SAMN05192529_105142 [Arachidicoccus rhizosphaerae]
MDNCEVHYYVQANRLQYVDQLQSFKRHGRTSNRMTLFTYLPGQGCPETVNLFIFKELFNSLAFHF